MSVIAIKMFLVHQYMIFFSLIKNVSTITVSSLPKQPEFEWMNLGVNFLGIEATPTMM